MYILGRSPFFRYGKSKIIATVKISIVTRGFEGLKRWITGDFLFHWNYSAWWSNGRYMIFWFVITHNTLQNKKQTLMCANISSNLEVWGSLSGVQTVIKESKCNTNKWNNLTEKDGGGGGKWCWPKYFGKWMDFIRIKAKGIAHKHCILFYSVVSYRGTG